MDDVIDVVTVGVDEVGEGLLGRGTAGVGAGFGAEVGDSVLGTGFTTCIDGFVAAVCGVGVAEFNISVETLTMS